ncbi:MAG: amidophosphoribosyltransferase [Pseudomonadota bacterium]|nr:amidophosphoribosyltransferase [Pseudomonadota bacterium]
MCGVIGTVAANPVNQDIYDALTVIQHRGQDAAGIMTCEGQRIHLRKHTGLVRDAIRANHMLRLKGSMGVGHVRYPTAGTESAAEAQPLYVNSPYGLGIVHNGNLINADELKHDVLDANLRHLNTDSDSEVLLNVFAYELQQLGQRELSPEAIYLAVRAVQRRCIGSYSAIVLIADYGIVAFRDPHGIRPLVFGSRHHAKQTEYMIASESVALDVLGYKRIDDVQPGEAIIITQQGELFRHSCASRPTLNPCIFEAVYLSRPDTVLDGISVHEFRLHLGELLAQRILQEFPNHDIDVVIPIPDTSRTIAIPVAKHLSLKYREGFVKNRYIGRTFIMPGQQQRSKSVRQKLNPIPREFANKNVLLIDDSIVRGTTSKEIVSLAREAGAKKVYFASASPPVIFPNVYGIDMPSVNELIAHNRTIPEICQRIGADRLFYLQLDELYAAAKRTNPAITRYEDSIFTGDYITGHVDQQYLDALASKRGTTAQ